MKVTVPNGKDIVMSKEIFEQDPELFMKMMVGGLVIGCLTNDEGHELEDIFVRDDLIKILKKDWDKQKDWTFEEYQIVFNSCI